MLAKRFETDFAAGTIDNDRILTIRISRPETDNRSRLQPFFPDDLREQRLCVVVQLGGFDAAVVPSKCARVRKRPVRAIARIRFFVSTY